MDDVKYIPLTEVTQALETIIKWREQTVNAFYEEMGIPDIMRNKGNVEFIPTLTSLPNDFYKHLTILPQESDKDIKGTE